MTRFWIRPGPRGLATSGRWLVAVALASLLGAWPGAAGAWAARADPAYPSAERVRGAERSVATTAARVARVEAALAAGNARLDVARTRVQVAAEAYDEAKIQLDQRGGQARAAQARSELAARTAERARAAVGRLAVDTYYDGQGFGGLEVIIGARTPQELVESAAGYGVVSSVIDQTFQQARSSTVAADAARTQADAALAAQAAAAARLSTTRGEAEARAAEVGRQTRQIQILRSRTVARLAALRRTSVALEAERQSGIEAAARARAAAAQRAAARSAAARERAERPRPQPPPSTGSSSGSGGSRAADWALSQLGKDYEWAADGPSTYDCSGLTLKAWAQAGVYLPHSSRAQYQLTEHVDYGSLRPGDLLFYATNTSDPGSIHHVGIYLGGGRMVEAPYTGAQVRVSSIYRSDLMPYAGRP